MLAAGKVLPVRGWPQSQWLAVQDIRSVQAVTVVGVATPVSPHRLAARTLVRDALRHTLAGLLDQPAAAIALVSRPGQAIALDSPRVHLGLSVGHAPGLSLAAIGRGAGVGVDVMCIEDGVEAHSDWLCVARDYLGPQATARLQATSAAQCPVAFGQAWTRFEAGLKCLGRALTEWSPQLEQQLATCQIWPLDFARNPRGTGATDGNFLGSIAVRTAVRPTLHPAER